MSRIGAPKRSASQPELQELLGKLKAETQRAVADQSKEISELKGQISEINNTLAKIASGVKTDNVVKAPVDIFKPTLWYTALDRHLATFMSHFAFVTCTALSTLVTFCRCTTFT